MRRQITFKNRILFKLTLYFHFFSSYPACHNPIADLDETVTSVTSMTEDVYIHRLHGTGHNAPDLRAPPRAAAASPAVSAAPRVDGLEPMRADAPSGCGFWKWLRVTVLLHLLTCRLRMLHTRISINELLKDGGCDADVLPGSDEQNTPKRHIF